MNIYEKLIKFEPKGIHNQVPVVWKNADGSGYMVYGNKFDNYMDFTSGILITNAGHSPYSVQRAIQAQAGKLLTSGLFANEPRAHLVEKLADISGMEKVFLMSSGGEAIEAAMRFMSAYAGANRILGGGMWGLKGAFHGRSAGCLSIAKWILSPLRYEGGLPHTPTYDTTNKPKGLFIETFFGYNAQFHDKAWIQDLCAEAKEHNVPVCFDEIQAGFGRTGKMFGFEHYEVKPDLIVVGKGLGGGMPISAVLGRADILDSIESDLTSTHTGNPICCVSALATLEVIEKDGLVEKAREMGEFLEPYLPELFPEYTVRGRGMVWAIDIGDKDFTNRIVERCAERGLLLLKTHRGTIKIAPPLTIGKEQMMAGLQIIREVISGS